MFFFFPGQARPGQPGDFKELVRLDQATDRPTLIPSCSLINNTSGHLQLQLSSSSSQGEENKKIINISFVYPLCHNERPKQLDKQSWVVIFHTPLVSATINVGDGSFVVVIHLLRGSGDTTLGYYSLTRALWKFWAIRTNIVSLQLLYSPLVGRQDCRVLKLIFLRFVRGEWPGKQCRAGSSPAGPVLWWWPGWCVMVVWGDGCDGILENYENRMPAWSSPVIPGHTKPSSPEELVVYYVPLSPLSSPQPGISLRIIGFSHWVWDWITVMVESGVRSVITLSSPRWFEQIQAV